MQEYRYSTARPLPDRRDARCLNCLACGGRCAMSRCRSVAGDYDHAVHSDHPDAPSLLAEYIKDEPAEPKLGGAPQVTEQPSEMEKQFPSAAKKDE